MRKEENVNNVKEMGMETNEPEVMDETDLRIMQALSDELSDITVSEELIARTLRAAKEQKKAGEERKEKEQWGVGENRKKKKARVYRIWGGALTAAAALLIVVLGVGTMRLGRKDASNEYSGSAANESMMNGMDNASAGQSGSMEDSTVNESAAITDGEAKGEWEDIFSDGNSYEINDFHGNEIQGSEIQDWNGTESADMTNEAGGSFDVEEPLPESGATQETPDETAAENERRLYDELLAAFDTAEEITPESDAETKGDARSISWQGDGRTLSCVIYREDYRIVATLEENGVRRQIVLENWAYACELWELAGEGENRSLK